MHKCRKEDAAFRTDLKRTSQTSNVVGCVVLIPEKKPFNPHLMSVFTDQEISISG